VPFLSWCNVAMHAAVGTSAAIGFPLALAGSLGFVLNGLKVGAELPPMSLGFIYLPAFIGIAAVSILSAPLGARIAHRLPVTQLKRAFAVFLYLIGLRMLWTLL